MPDLTLALSGNQAPWIVFAAIVLTSFVLEDMATLLSALAVADGRIPLELAVGSLLTGLILGDLGVYVLGWLAARHPWAQRLVATDKAQKMQGWIDNRLISTVISTRFLPGARLPVYSACGFLGVSFSRYALSVLAATLIWSIFIFGIALAVGHVIMTNLGPWRWPIGVVLALTLFGTNHLIAKRHQRKTDAKDVSK